jgi:hypothetical protein
MATRTLLGEAMTAAQRLRRDVLAHADQLVSDTRAEQYGDAAEGFARIADLWTAAFPHLLNAFRPEDVALAMILVKVARLEPDNVQHFDSWADIAGYAALGAEVAGATPESAS